MLYLKLDVLLIACVIERFWEKTLREDELDPVHFIILPGLSFLSALKMKNEEIDLWSDLEMYAFFERVICGGITFVNKHLARNEAITINNKQHDVDLGYADENNL